jgi:hypothetical protein
MSKYAALGDYLARQTADTISLSFAEVEKILGFKLPASAYRQRTWWSNNPHNNVMTKVWRRAEFRSRQVDMEHRKVVFQRKKMPQAAPVSDANRQKLSPRHHPLRGALKGMLRIVGGTDLTAPAGAWNNR